MGERKTELGSVVWKRASPRRLHGNSKEGSDLRGRISLKENLVGVTQPGEGLVEG